MTTRARLVFALAAIVGVAGCASILGVDDYEPFSCVGACEGDAGDARPNDGAAASDGAPDGRLDGGGDGATDAGACGELAPCPSGHRVVVTFVDAGAAEAAEGGTPTIVSDPVGISVRPGESGAACFRSGRLDLEVFGGRADFAGVVCDDPLPTSDCRFDLLEPLCIVATPR